MLPAYEDLLLFLSSRCNPLWCQSAVTSSLIQQQTIFLPLVPQAPKAESCLDLLFDGVYSASAQISVSIGSKPHFPWTGHSHGSADAPGLQSRDGPCWKPGRGCFGSQHPRPSGHFPNAVALLGTAWAATARSGASGHR